MNKSVRCLLSPVVIRRVFNGGFHRPVGTEVLAVDGFTSGMEMRVKQYGKLFVVMPCNVVVMPIDSHAFPDMNTLIVKVRAAGKAEKKSGEIECQRRVVEDFVNIEIKDDVCRITSEKVDDKDIAMCLVKAPIQYDVHVRTPGDSRIEISGMVSDLIHAQSERGNILGKKLQAKEIKFHSKEGGSIDLENSIQGNISIKTTKNGSIRAEKCLGTSLAMTTENGDMTLGSNYCETSVFTTINGNLNLDNLHMDATVDVKGKGSLNVSCLDGSLQANLNEGQTKVQIVRLTTKSKIASNGPIHIIVPKENNTQFNLKAKILLLPENFNEKSTKSGDQEVYQSCGEISLNAETSASLRITSASWEDSLLAKFKK